MEGAPPRDRQAGEDGHCRRDSLEVGGRQVTKVHVGRPHFLCYFLRARSSAEKEEGEVRMEPPQEKGRGKVFPNPDGHPSSWVRCGLSQGRVLISQPGSVQR